MDVTVIIILMMLVTFGIFMVLCIRRRQQMRRMQQMRLMNQHAYGDENYYPVVSQPIYAPQPGMQGNYYQAPPGPNPPNQNYYYQNPYPAQNNYPNN